jgi:hypothetical protein
MDHNGDSEGNFSVAALKPYRYVYSTKMYNFTCDYFIRPVAGFQQGENPVSLYVSSTESHLLLSAQTFLCVVGFEVLTAVVMKSIIFWHITPCSPLSVNQRFGGTA